MRNPRIFFMQSIPISHEYRIASNQIFFIQTYITVIEDYVSFLFMFSEIITGLTFTPHGR